MELVVLLVTVWLSVLSAAVCVGAWKLRTYRRAILNLEGRATALEEDATQPAPTKRRA